MQGDNGDEWALFRRQMSDVRPIKAQSRVAVKGETPSQKALAERRRAAQALAETGDTNFLSGDYVPSVGPHDFLDFKREGVQNGVHRKLRLGKYAVDARLDLHRMTVEQARLAVHQFIRDCMAQDIRCALITHGKGEGRERPALLKSCVAHWLPQFSEVLAMHSAQKHHGGSGATYVLLRKSERKRQENWERQHKKN